MFKTKKLWNISFHLTTLSNENSRVPDMYFFAIVTAMFVVAAYSGVTPVFHNEMYVLQEFIGVMETCERTLLNSKQRRYLERISRQYVVILHEFRIGTLCGFHFWAKSKEVAESIPGFSYVEENIYYEIETQKCLNGSSWGASLLLAECAPNTTAGHERSVVFLLDTEIDSTHQELKETVIKSSFEMSVRNFTQHTRSRCPMTGHGTHIAGIISGLAQVAKIVEVKISEGNIVATSDVIGGLEHVVYAVRNKLYDIRGGSNHGSLRPLVHFSFGGLGDNKALKEAIHQTVKEGLPVVVPSGDAKSLAALHSPGSMKEVITVASSNKYNELDPNSNYGSKVDLIAPGVDILSSWTDGGHQCLTGSAVAAAHVSGVAAIILSRSAISPEQLKQRLIQNASIHKTSKVCDFWSCRTPNRFLSLCGDDSSHGQSIVNFIYIYRYEILKQVLFAYTLLKVYRLS